MNVVEVNIVITPDGRLTRRDAAAYLGVAAKTLGNWMLAGFGPPSSKVGGRRFYRLVDLQAFVAEQGVRS